MSNDTSILAFIFDSGRLGDMWYGRVVFEYMMKGKELTRNPSKMIQGISSKSLF